eukprot:4246201-Amphidinium_carterae.3
MRLLHVPSKTRKKPLPAKSCASIPCFVAQINSGHGLRHCTFYPAWQPKPIPNQTGVKQLELATTLQCHTAPAKSAPVAS